ncbi:MAG TPA: hypothetical protein VFL57_07875 [Bryobacteraceae bacterium]|nr:hypothetical protein [Bryobacteraceae bacterium]
MRGASCVLLAASLVCAEAGQLKREGAYWVEVVTGSMPLMSTAQFRIGTVGGVAVRGAADGRVNYVLRKRVRARSEAQAQRLLTGVRISTARTLTVLQPPNHPAWVDLEVRLPRGLRLVAVRTRAGDLSFAGLDGSIDVESLAGNLTIDEIGGGVAAKTGGGEIRIGRVGGPLRCVSGGGSIRVVRSGGEAWLETRGGEVYVGESGGPVHAATAGGNIVVERAGSWVSANTAAGRIEVQHARGAVSAENSGGSIEVGPAAGARVEASGGAIRLRGTSGALRAATDVGSIRAELIRGVMLKDSLLSTGGGDVTVFIPSNLALTVKAQNPAGRPARIVSDFPDFLHRTAAAILEGSLNGGGPVLTISASGGTIYLREQR